MAYYANKNSMIIKMAVNNHNNNDKSFESNAKS